MEGLPVQNLMILAALGFASARATQLVVDDTIGDPLRKRLELWHARKHTSKVRTFIRSLLGCIMCAGWWLSLITTLVYLVAADQWSGTSLWVHAVECWVVMGFQVTLNLRWDRDAAQAR